jgi:hypothetical protein
VLTTPKAEETARSSCQVSSSSSCAGTSATTRSTACSSEVTAARRCCGGTASTQLAGRRRCGALAYRGTASRSTRSGNSARRCSWPRVHPRPRSRATSGPRVDTVSRVYAHWLRDDRSVPAEVLERVLAAGRDTPRVQSVSSGPTGHDRNRL